MQYRVEQLGQFIKAMQGQKLECYLALMIAYNLSRGEVSGLEWTDIDFNKDRIMVCLITDNGIRKEELKRVFPLLPHIKTLLLELKLRQEEDAQTNGYNREFMNFIFIQSDGTKHNKRVLGRNQTYITELAGLPETDFNGLFAGMDSFLRQIAPGDFYSFWTRADILGRKISIYDSFDEINDHNSRKTLEKINKFIESGEHIKSTFSEM